tara:strand:- start:22435 stop:23286 length:852 start_codon:yes stop_codon:yes gene_type:complete
MVNTIGIGFSRTGSTWLSRCLEEHPEICFSKEKETHFFNLDARFNEGVDSYHSYFDCGDEKVVAEFTAVYTRDSEKVAERIHAYNPKTKLLVMLRNPADRAFSNYIYRKSRVGGYESFEKAVEENDQIVQEGLYAKHLAPFFELFPIEQFIFVVQEESRKNPKETIQEVYGELGIDSQFIPSCIGREVNASKDHAYKLPWLQHAIQRTRMAVHKSKLLGPIRNLVKFFGVTKIISNVQKANEAKGEAKEEMLESTRSKLLKYYAEDIQSLEEKTGLNLDIWKR